MTDPLVIYTLIVLGLAVVAVVGWPPNWIRFGLFIHRQPERRAKFIAALLAEIDKEKNPHVKNVYAWMVAIALAERNV